MSNIQLFEALEGFVLNKQAAGKSVNTLRNYRNTFAKVKRYFSHNPLLEDLTRANWVDFFVWLQDDVVQPAGIAPRPAIPLAPKSIANIHTDLCAFYTWATSDGVDLTEKHLLRTVERPVYERPLVETFTCEQIKALLKACDQSRAWRNQTQTHNKRPTKERDRAIILLLLSTGIRASELCDIRYADVNMSERSIRIGGKGKGRDKKERRVYFGKSTTRALWQYITPRLSSIKPHDPLFTVGPADAPRPMTRDILRRTLKRIGDRAGIVGVYPHRFRHTFATEFLRNNGDLLKLKALLGHESLEMVQRYAHVVAADCAAAHEDADPVDNWRL